MLSSTEYFLWRHPYEKILCNSLSLLIALCVGVTYWAIFQTLVDSYQGENKRVLVSGTVKMNSQWTEVWNAIKSGNFLNLFSFCYFPLLSISSDNEVTKSQKPFPWGFHAVSPTLLPLTLFSQDIRDHHSFIAQHYIGIIVQIFPKWSWLHSSDHKNLLKIYINSPFLIRTFKKTNSYLHNNHLLIPQRQPFTGSLFPPRPIGSLLRFRQNNLLMNQVESITLCLSK